MALPRLQVRGRIGRVQWRRLFVTGGSGYLGSHIVNGPASDGWNLIAPSSGSLDLRFNTSVDAVIGDWRPTAIIHTAYRRDDRASIVDASRHVARAANKHGARLVHVSSDAIFAGRAWAYVESDPPTPIHQYGIDKADAEQAVLSECPNAVVVRTSLLIGQSQLSPHEVAVRDAITGRKDIRFFSDEFRNPAIVDDVAAACVELATRSEITGTLHVAGPDCMSRAELATRIAKRHDWDPDKLRFTTHEEADVVRPDRVELDSTYARSLGIGVRGPRSWD